MKTTFLCKCGKSFQKNTSSDTTGYRLPGYGEGHECYGCPYALSVKDALWNSKTEHFEYIIRAWECRASKKLSYGSHAALSLGSKNSGSIYSLDLPFLREIRMAIDSIEGISADSDAPGERGVQYGSDGLYRLPVYPEQNKKGVRGKQQLFDDFFNPDGSRKDVSSTEEKQIVLRQIEEAKTMGKINVGNITAGLNKVKSLTEALSKVSRHEMIPVEYIEPADNNPFAENDTDESRYELAMSIQANGLLEPLVLNKKSDTCYKLIAGEHRFTAIKQYLPEFKNISSMVFEEISDDEAQLKLYEANRQREYTSEQKFKRYRELELLLTRMKESGSYHGPIQRGLAELLGVSTRQVRKYKGILQNLSEEDQQQVMKGEISVDTAYQIVQSQKEEDRQEPPIGDAEEFVSEDNHDQMANTGITAPVPRENNNTDTAFPFANERNVSSQGGTPTEKTVKEEKSGSASGFSDSYWKSKIEFAIKSHYDAERLFQFYTFEVPTTVEAIKEIKPTYGYSGGSVIFPDGVHGDCTCHSSHMDIEYQRKHLQLTYSQVDGYVRDMIRKGRLLTEKQVSDVLSKHLDNIDEGE
jgi:Predicted transcriptional regulators